VQPAEQLPALMFVVAVVAKPFGGAPPLTVSSATVTESVPAPTYFGLRLAAALFAAGTAIRNVGVTNCPCPSPLGAAEVVPLLPPPQPAQVRARSKPAAYRCLIDG
jgi:hypothetical protein